MTNDTGVHPEPDSRGGAPSDDASSPVQDEGELAASADGSDRFDLGAVHEGE